MARISARAGRGGPGDPARRDDQRPRRARRQRNRGGFTHDGKLWVVWYDDHVPTYHAVLGDARGAGGTVQDLGIPA